MRHVRSFIVLLLVMTPVIWSVGCSSAPPDIVKKQPAALQSLNLPLPTIEAHAPKTAGSLESCSDVPGCDRHTCFVVNETCVNAEEKQSVVSLIAHSQTNVINALKTLDAPKGLVTRLVTYIAKEFEYDVFRDDPDHGIGYGTSWQDIKVLAVNLNDDGRIDYLIENCSAKSMCMGNGGPPLEVYYSVGSGYRFAELDNGVVIGADAQESKVYISTHGSRCGNTGSEGCCFAFELTSNGVGEGRLCARSSAELEAFKIRGEWLEVVNDGREDISPFESGEISLE